MKRVLMIGAAAAALATAAYAQSGGGVGAAGEELRPRLVHSDAYGRGAGEGPRGYWGRRHGEGMERGDRAERRAARIERMLGEADADGDGSVSVAEAQNIGATRFAAMDANGDGFVEARELLDYRLMRRAELGIARHDADGDGRWSLEEAPQPRMDMSRFDLDENGVITRTEIETAMQSRRGEGRRWGRGPGGRDDLEDDLEDEDGGPRPQ